jgi:hypothetical protein
MATTRPFAYNTGSTITGTIQVGNLAIGVDNLDYSTNPGGVRWWMGPDEDLGYVIAKQVPSGNQPNPLGVDAYIGFNRSDSLTDESFLSLVNGLSLTAHTFTVASNAKTWLNDNGYWTSWEETQIPSNTPTQTLTNTPTQTTTQTLTNTPTPTQTPTQTSEETQTPTQTLTNTPTQTLTNTPTPTLTPTQTLTNTPTQTLTNTQTLTQTLTNTPTPTLTAVKSVFIFIPNL